MPAIPFISYSQDRAIVEQLARALRLHGIPAWRDEDSLPFGERTQEAIQAELASCDGALLWLSERTIASDYVKRIELPAIHRELQRREFRLFPIFVGMSPEAGIDALLQATGIHIGNHNGCVIDLTANVAAETTRIAKRYVATSLADRANVPRPPILRCVTRDDTALRRDAADLNFDWRHEHRGGLPDASTSATLQDAIGTGAEEVKANFQHHKVELELKCHLHLGVAFGHAFRKTTGRVPIVRADAENMWSCIDVASSIAEGLPHHTSNEDVTSRSAAILISLTQDVTAGVNAFVAQSGARYARRLSFEAPSGPGQFAVPDALTANAWAQQVADAMQSVQTAGIDNFDIFLAAPVTFAVMLGWRLNAVGSVRLFHWTGNRGPYAEAWNLPPV